MIEQRLINWARYWRVGLHKRVTPSLEGRYRAPRGAEIDWETEPAAMAPLPSPDAADAILVESAWVSLPNPAYKAFLRFHYCQRRSTWYIKRKLRIFDYDGAMLLAHAAIMRSIDNKTSVFDKQTSRRSLYIVRQITAYAMSVHQPDGRLALAPRFPDKSGFVASI